MPPIQNPRRASWGITLSDKDFAALKGGCIIRDMDDRWRFVAVTDEELADELSTAEKGTADQVPPEEPTTDDECDELEEEPPWVQEERTEKAPPARAVTEEDMAVGGYISIRRTWSNTELYRLVLTVQAGEDGVSRKIEAVIWEQREEHLISEEQAKIDVILLCRSHLECDLANAPDDDALEFSGLL